MKFSVPWECELHLNGTVVKIILISYCVVPENIYPYTSHQGLFAWNPTCCDAKFQEHCFNISRDIVYSVLSTFQLQTVWRHHWSNLHINKKMSISLKRKKIFQKEKPHSSVFWKAFQISTNYFSFHRHLNNCEICIEYLNHSSLHRQSSKMMYSLEQKNKHTSIEICPFAIWSTLCTRNSFIKVFITPHFTSIFVFCASTVVQFPKWHLKRK